MGLSQYDERSPAWQQGSLTIASGTTVVDMFTPTGSAVRVDAVLVSSTSLTPQIVDLWLTRYDGNGLVGSVSIPAGAGFAGVPIVDLIASIAPAAIGALVLLTGVGLGVGVEVALTGSDTLGVQVLGGYV
jgi:hypothetical protein